MTWIAQNLWLIPVLPLVASGVIAVSRQPQRKLAVTLSIGSMVLAFLLSLCAFSATLLHHGESGVFREVAGFNWIRFGGQWLQLGWVLDPLTALTTLWSRKLRTSIPFMFFISIVVNTGMWFERFVIVVTSLYRDFLPSSWGTYRATKWDYMTYVGTLGLFTALFLLFVRFLPMIPMSEIRMMLPGAKITPKQAAKVGD